MSANVEALPDVSALGLPLRAESAANGDTELDRAGVRGSVRRASAGAVEARNRGWSRDGNGCRIAQQLFDRQQTLRMRHFQQSEFEVEALFLAVSEFSMGAQHDLQMAGQVFFGEQIGDAADAGALIGRNLQQRRVLACDLRHRDIAQEAHQLAREMRGTVAFADQFVDQHEDFLA